MGHVNHLVCRILLLKIENLIIAGSCVIGMVCLKSTYYILYRQIKSDDNLKGLLSNNKMDYRKLSKLMQKKEITNKTVRKYFWLHEFFYLLLVTIFLVGTYLFYKINFN